MRTAAALLAIALVALPDAAAARFAPATHAPYRLSRTTVRDEAGTIRRFATDYDLAFTRTREGYRATLTARPGSVSDTAAERDDRFARLQRAAAGEPLAIRLDRAGRLLGVDGAERRWATMRAVIAQVAIEGRDALLAAHDRLTPAERDRALAADILALCAGAEADRRQGERRTTLLAAGGAALAVREAVHRDRDTVTIVAEGSDAATPAYLRRRVVDRRTGLVREGVETRRLIAVHDGATATATLTHRTVLTPPVS